MMPRLFDSFGASEKVVGTMLMVTTIVILGVTGKGAPAAMAGLAIGLALVVIHSVGISETDVSVNPARSVGPALFVGGKGIAQFWLFIVALIVGAVAAGLLFKAGTLDAAE
ncbi:aquaporin [Ascidiaceihabitans sp.]|nr:aquaporin [Ascidiaceihabitans sp.]